MKFKTLKNQRLSETNLKEYMIEMLETADNKI